MFILFLNLEKSLKKEIKQGTQKAPIILSKTKRFKPIRIHNIQSGQLKWSNSYIFIPILLLFC